MKKTLIQLDDDYDLDPTQILTVKITGTGVIKMADKKKDIPIFKAEPLNIIPKKS